MKNQVIKYVENIKRFGKGLIALDNYQIANLTFDDKGRPVAPEERPENIKRWNQEFVQESIKMQSIKLQNMYSITDVNLKQLDATPLKKIRNYKLNLFDICSKDRLRPAMTGIFHEDGYQIATDANVMVVIKQDYPNKNEGKIIDKSGIQIDGRFPPYKAIIPQSYEYKKKIDLIKFAALLESYNTIYKKYVDYKIFGAIFNINGSEVAINVQCALKIVSTLIAAGHQEAVLKFTGNLSEPITLTADDDLGLMMPISLRDDKDHVPSFSFQDIEAIKAPQKSTKKKEVKVGLDKINKALNTSFKSEKELTNYLKELQHEFI